MNNIINDDLMMDENIKLLNKANKLFLKKLFRDSLPIYNEILKSEPENIDVINNKGYALSKMKNYDEAISCYDKGLEINPTEKFLVINKISALRKKGLFEDALELCNLILKDNSSENVTLYHKLRILYSMKKFKDSINICDNLLESYPNNGDVLFDKSCNHAALGEVSAAMLNLKLAIGISNKFKINAKKNNVFESLKDQDVFLELVK